MTVSCVETKRKFTDIAGHKSNLSRDEEQSKAGKRNGELEGGMWQFYLCHLFSQFLRSKRVSFTGLISFFIRQ